MISIISSLLSKTFVFIVQFFGGGKVGNIDEAGKGIPYLCAMPLYEEMLASGNWLFRRRSYVPLLLYIVAVFAIFVSTHDFFSFHALWWQILCLMISMSGLIVRAITIGHTPHGTSGRNTKEGQVAESLNTTGMYSLLRHPLYLGNFLMWLGLIIYTGTLWFNVLAVMFFWLYYERIMMAEEAFIRSKFGDEYESWASKVPAFIPRLHGWVSSGLSFSFKNVLKREYNGFFATFLSFTIINVLKNYQAHRELLPDKFWLYSLPASALIFMVLRTIKKTTRWLEAEGR